MSGELNAQIAHRWFEHWFGAEMIGLCFAEKCGIGDRRMTHQKGLIDKLTNRVAALTARVAELEA